MKTRRILAKSLHQNRKGALYLGLGMALGLMPSLAFAQATPAEAQQTPTRIRSTVAQPPIPVADDSGGGDIEGGSDKQYLILRYNEDWSYLKDPSKRKNFLDPFKFIPLDASKDSYVTLFGDERIRNVNESTKNVKKGTSATNFTAVRTDFGADIHITPYFRGFVQFVSAYDLGDGHRIGALPASFQNPFDVLQAFVEPMGQIGRVKVGLRVGREVMKWGNGTVIDPNDFPNVQTAFDAVHPYAVWDQWRVDAFVSDAVTLRSHTFEDSNNPSVKVDGVYIAKKYHGFDFLGMKVKGAIEPFFFNYLNNAGKYGAQTGNDDRQDYGLRFVANFRGFDFDEEGVYQGGKFANRTVNAWAFFGNQGYTARSLPLKPRVGLQVVAASGGDGPKGNTIQTYQPLFPSTNYFCDMAFFSPSNLIEFRPNMTFHVTRDISLEGLYGFFYRQNPKDAIYASSPFAPYGSTAPTATATSSVKGRALGQVPQIIVSWQITPQVLLSQYVSALLPSQTLKDAGGGKGDLFFASTLLLRF
jgi:hypothetical protein